MPADPAARPILAGVLAHAGVRPDWDSYLASVYGTVSYPFDLNRLSWLYNHAPASQEYDAKGGESKPKGWTGAGVKHAMWTFGQLGRWPPVHISHAGYFVGRNSTRAADVIVDKRGESWVEVIRFEAGRDAETPASGTWYFAVTGSGVFLRLGRTMDMRCVRGWSLYYRKDWRKNEGYRYCANTSSGALEDRITCSPAACEHVMKKAKTLPFDHEIATKLSGDYDTMIRLYEFDRTTRGLGDLARIEVVDLRSGPTRACPGARGDAQRSALASGWNAGLGQHVFDPQPCSCSSRVALASGMVNCGSYGGGLFPMLMKMNISARSSPQVSMPGFKCKDGTCQADSKEAQRRARQQALIHASKKRVIRHARSRKWIQVA